MGKYLFSKFKINSTFNMGSISSNDDTQTPVQEDTAPQVDPRLERTFIMVKPDGVQRGAVGKIIKRFEAKGFKLVAMKMMRPSREHVEMHYDEHRGRVFF